MGAGDWSLELWMLLKFVVIKQPDALHSSCQILPWKSRIVHICHRCTAQIWSRPVFHNFRLIRGLCIEVKGFPCITFVDWTI